MTLHDRIRAVVEERDWRVVPDFPRYRVSRQGEVHGQKRILRGSTIRNGYITVDLRADDGRQRCVLVHVLVAELFIGPKPPGLQVNHLDGNRRNCAVSNLEYVTASQNVRHSFDVLGRIPTRGSRINMARLTEAKVRDMRARYAAGEVTPRHLATEFDVSIKTIYFALKRKSWNFPEAEPGYEEGAA